MGADVVIKPQFQSKFHNGNNGIRAYILDYTMRTGAVEPLIIDAAQHAQYLQSITDLTAPDDSDAVDILNHRLHFSGIGFDLQNLSLSREEQTQRANEAQAAYDRGGSILQPVISFDTDYLRRMGLLDEDTSDLPLAGDFRGKVDQYRLRQAVTDGVNAMMDQTTMHDPQAIGAVQTDAAMVHVHLSIWDQDKTVKDNRGYLNNTQKAAFVSAFKDSLQMSPSHLNTTNMLTSVAKTTQNNARFKRQMLADQLYQSALRLDRPALNEYVSNLESFDQKTLSATQRQQVKHQIERDWQRQGRSDRRSHTLSHGQRQMRQQVRAMTRATMLRQDIGRYDKFARKDTIARQASPVKSALMFEYQHQLAIVDKYRHMQRPRVQAIYLARKDQLTAQRTKLQAQRTALLPQLGAKPNRPRYIRELLRQPKVVAQLAKTVDGPFTQSTLYHDLRQTQAHPELPIPGPSLKKIKQALPKETGETVVHKLSHNQQLQPNTFSSAQRILLAQYLQDLEQYERDAVSWGGLGVNQLQYRDPNQLTTLPEPAQTQSIYDRRSLKDEPGLVAADVHQTMTPGHLRPSVELALRQEAQQRYQQLKQAQDYFKMSEQSLPEWLLYAQKDLNQQFDQIDDATQDLPAKQKTEPTVMVDGYVLDNNQQNKLVDKHLNLVDRLSIGSIEADVER